MNFSFNIVRLGVENKRCQFYTIVKEGEKLNEAVKFLSNQMNQDSPDFTRLKTRQRNIKDRHGARWNFFKLEGAEDSLVQALHAGAKKKSGYIEQNKLRWYCIRLSERCVIFGNGGVKTHAKTQNDPHLKEKESDMRWVDRCIDAACKAQEFGEDVNGNIFGVVEFNKEKISSYGLQ